MEPYRMVSNIIENNLDYVGQSFEDLLSTNKLRTIQSKHNPWLVGNIGMYFITKRFYLLTLTTFIFFLASRKQIFCIHIISELVPIGNIYNDGH